MTSLLDVNVLLALLDGDHVNHQEAWTFLDGHIGEGWASCPITQNGFVRIISQPRYPSPVPVPIAVERLAAATGTELHTFWPDKVSLLDDTVVDRSQLLGAGQITDAYLLALAVANGGRLVTFDASLPLSAVQGARTDHLLVI